MVGTRRQPLPPDRFTVKPSVLPGPPPPRPKLWDAFLPLIISATHPFSMHQESLRERAACTCVPMHLNYRCIDTYLTIGVWRPTHPNYRCIEAYTAKLQMYELKAYTKIQVYGGIHI